MKNPVHLSAVLLLLCLAGCRKEQTENLSTSPPAPEVAAKTFTRFVIPQGAHYTTGNDLKAITCSELRFAVRFDSSCIYQTVDPKNQGDINKLYGFSDNGAAHHQFSARFGWRWSDGALRLFAYVYNKGQREAKEHSTVSIGQEVQCSIKVGTDTYQFTVDKKTAVLPRLSTTPAATGYRLYPYFGGDETAPHDVRIWIREE